MQATERVLSSDNWITILFVFCLLLMFLLKLFNAEKMKGYAFSIFNKGFVEIESQEKKAGFSAFDTTFIGFSFISMSLTIYFLLNHYQKEIEFGFVEFTKISSYVLIYMLGRAFLEFLLMRLFGIKEILGQFFLSKRSYLYSISIGLFFLNLLYFYGFQKITLLLTGIILLFAIRLVLILINNKNLIIKELFYFILYLCSFEIAPLLILFKLIF
ncbi:DUF4271 domain-containing protein [Pseudotenacibaculum haliotis]|uniref:DUF4271 domain-containing protein n=1 Tax=Pseudotenacibaculum haliotis TaxID=1862138 RepID=A0ABW5LRD3_9FLAO